MNGVRLKRTLALCTALLGTMLVGCGGDDADDVTPFIGEWQYTSGTTNTQCQSVAVNNTDQLAGDKFRIGKGIDSPLVYSEADTNCVWKMNVNGNTASIISGQSCMFTAEGRPTTAMYTAGTFTVSGNTAVFSGSGTAAINFDGAIVNCNYTGMGGLSKVSQ